VKEPRRKKHRRRISANRGRAYQLVVAEIARAFDPGANVEEGQWIKGPDGRLDMDVCIRGTVEGAPWLVVIECKDFNPKSTGRVGREFVDALDSKRYDLKANAALICSNSGFTADALSKAKRKNIGMISVLRRGDPQIRVRIEEDIYIRRITFEKNWKFDFTAVDDSLKRLAPVDALDIRFDGKPIVLWLQWKARFFAIEHPELTAPLRWVFTFKQPLTCFCRDVAVTLTSMAVQFSCSTEWRVQKGRIDVALGLYDYVRQRSRRAPGDNQYVIEGIDFHGGTPCDPPQIANGERLLPGETRMDFVHFFNVITDDGEAPKLDQFVVPEDLVARLEPTS